jgi:Lon protease-like protein
MPAPRDWRCVAQATVSHEEGHNIYMPPRRLIPLFPLHLVVFPRTNLPLHIFEERYKEMTGKVMRDNSEFGIVLAKDEGIVNAGCTVSVEKLVHAYPDGRMDILTRGRNRFEVAELNDEQSYLQAEIEYFDDEDTDSAPPELRERALENFKALLEIDHGRERDVNLEDPQLSFQLAQTLPDLDFLNALLRHRSETGRLKHLIQYLEQYIPRQRTVERMKAVAPTNGFGKHAEI